MKKWLGISLAAAVGAAVLISVGSASASPARPAGAAQSAAAVQVAPAGVQAVAAAKTVTPTVIPEQQYVPVASCRIVDTRSGGGALGAGEIRSFIVNGTTGFVFQGGKSGGCGIPFDATSVSVSVTAISPTGAGFLKGWAFGATEPSGGTFLNYSKNVSLTTGASQLITPGAAKNWTVHNFGAKTQLAVDVTAYTVPQIEAYVTGAGVLRSATSRVLAVEHNSAGGYFVFFDRAVTTCSFQVTPFSGFYYASVGIDVNNVNRVFVTTWDLINGQHSFADIDFSIEANC